MAGEDHRDPAEIYRERREVVEIEIKKARFAEEASIRHGGLTSDLGSKALIAATNHRLRALCIHAGIEKIDGDSE